MCRVSNLSFLITEYHISQMPNQNNWKTRRHSCQPLLGLGVNLSPEFVNLYFPYAGRAFYFLFFYWWPRHVEFQPAHVAMEGRSNVVLNMHAWLQILLPTRFLAYCTRPVTECAFGGGMCRLLVRQFFSLFAQFKTTTKSHENYVFLYQFSNMAISPQNNEKNNNCILYR